MYWIKMDATRTLIGIANPLQKLQRHPKAAERLAGLFIDLRTMKNTSTFLSLVHMKDTCNYSHTSKVKLNRQRQVDGLHLRCAWSAGAGQRPQRYPFRRKWHDVEVHLRPRWQHPEKGTLSVCRHDDSSGKHYLRIR